MMTTFHRAALLSIALLGCGPTEAPRAPTYGAVRIASVAGTLNGAPRASTYVSALFIDDTARGASCTTRTVGPCVVRECAASDAGAPAGRPVFRSAGRVTIAGGEQTLTFDPDGNATYPSGGSGTMELFAPGTVLTVTAAGDSAGVPAWTGTVTMPARVNVTAPAVSGGTLSIRRAEPLAIAWTGDTTGAISVDLLSLASAGSDPPSVQCRFDAASGRATIAVEVLRALPAGSAALSFSADTSRPVRAGAYDITLSASAAVLADTLIRATLE
jgi:hypothetical protein